MQWGTESKQVAGGKESVEEKPEWVNWRETRRVRQIDSENCCNCFGNNRFWSMLRRVSFRNLESDFSQLEIINCLNSILLGNNKSYQNSETRIFWEYPGWRPSSAIYRRSTSNICGCHWMIRKMFLVGWSSRI